MNYRSLPYQVSDRIATIPLTRPEPLDAIDAALCNSRELKLLHKR
ncbi:MAG: hypothetical protein OXC98_05825 [bacterium]|nr:hypothetical protein [bacterium]